MPSSSLQVGMERMGFAEMLVRCFLDQHRSLSGGLFHEYE